MSRRAAYIVFSDDDISACDVSCGPTIYFGPARKTVHWRGKRFNVRTFRVNGFR